MSPTLFQFENYPEMGQPYDARGGGELEEPVNSFVMATIPEEVKKYLLFFRDVIRDMLVFEIPLVYSE